MICDGLSEYLQWVLRVHSSGPIYFVSLYDEVLLQPMLQTTKSNYEPVRNHTVCYVLLMNL